VVLASCRIYSAASATVQVSAESASPLSRAWRSGMARRPNLKHQLLRRAVHHGRTGTCELQIGDRGRV